MTQIPSEPNSNGKEPSVVSAPKTPRWVKIFGLVAFVLVVAFIILHLTGGGFSHHH